MAKHSQQAKDATFNSAVALFRGDRELREAGMPRTADYFMRTVDEAVEDGRLSQEDVERAERQSWLP